MQFKNGCTINLLRTSDILGVMAQLLLAQNDTAINSIVLLMGSGALISNLTDLGFARAKAPVELHIAIRKELLERQNRPTSSAESEK